MKNIMKYKIAILVILMASFAACDQEQDLAKPIDPTEKAEITITRVDGLTTVEEGDVLEFEITSNKMLKTAIDFTAALTAAGVDGLDYEVEGGILAPYTTSTTMSIHVLDDGFPELAETLSLEIGAFDIAQNWRLSPESDIASVSTQVANVNEEGVITIAVSWPNHDDDLDLYIWSVAEDDVWGASAGSDNPEISTALWPEDPNGTYYVGFEPYHLEASTTPYTFSIGFEDGTVQIIEGVYDSEATYDIDGSAVRLLRIELLDGVATITNLNPTPAE